MKRITKAKDIKGGCFYIRALQNLYGEVRYEVFRITGRPLKKLFFDGKTTTSLMIEIRPPWARPDQYGFSKNKFGNIWLDGQGIFLNTLFQSHTYLWSPKIQAFFEDLKKDQYKAWVFFTGKTSVAEFEKAKSLWRLHRELDELESSVIQNADGE
jgi:hypothetical protein